MRKRMLNRFKGIYDKGRIFAGAAVVALAAIGVHSVTTAQVAAAVNVSVDGDPKEWAGVEMQSSTDSAVAKWAVMQDEDYVYFYVQQNGGNEYGLPITNTFVSIKYQSGQGGSHTQIRFANMMKEFKDAWYGDIDGARGMYSPSKEADKYEIEFAVPKSFFVEEDYTITYCGSSVESTDIKDVKELAQPTPTTAVYQGITIDGTFTDWDAVAKKQVEDQWIRETAAVFDGRRTAHMARIYSARARRHKLRGRALPRPRGSGSRRNPEKRAAVTSTPPRKGGVYFLTKRLYTRQYLCAV